LADRPIRLLRRTLILAAFAIGGLALLAPLAARSAIPTPVAGGDRLLPSGASSILLDRGVLAGRQGAPTADVAPAGHEEIARTLPTPAAAPMEASLYPVSAPAAATPRQPAVTSSDDSVWDALARCESGGNWAIDSGNGYYGGLQFSHATWHGYGGGAFAEYPHEATREEQIVVAERLRDARGYAPWPACRAKLGLP
jgi:transglycosylase-like protein